jgi:carboxyl-terminal processing protease
VVTEGLGQRRFHIRVVMLVNEHTASAGEMVSSFAEENNLATIVETKTPGHLMSGSAYKVGHGYSLGLPVAAYLTWQGRMLENNGIAPKVSIEFSREALKQGRDTQLGTAIDVAKALEAQKPGLPDLRIPLVFHNLTRIRGQVTTTRLPG